MFDLCTVTNAKYIDNAILLSNSYLYYFGNNKIFIYYFDIPDTLINSYIQQHKDIAFIEIPKLFPHMYNTKVFLYKTYALKDLINNHSNKFIYSDATNMFIRSLDLAKYFTNNVLFLPYQHSLLINKYWTTHKCLLKMNALAYGDYAQYWAGFQGYISDTITVKLINSMYDFMTDTDIAFPDASVRNPDGENMYCIEHRGDQSVLSILIEQLNLHQDYSEEKQKLFGDKQTFQLMDNTYNINLSECCLVSRATKY